MSATEIPSASAAEIRDRVEVDIGWVADHLDDPSVRIVEVDVAPAAYREGHIPGAVLWNIYADLRDSAYVPIDKQQLEQLLRQSGVTDHTTVVFYGYGAHLGHWLLTSYGHRVVRLLDGPRDQWLAAGAWGKEERTIVPTDVRLAERADRLYFSRESVLEMLGRTDVVLLDTRSPLEYQGERFWPSGATEGAGRAGHIPGSVHLPIDELRSQDGRFLGHGEMERALLDRGVGREQRIVTYCTVGNRASQAWYALTHLLGYCDVGVYHGSWAEWGTLADTPVEC